MENHRILTSRTCKAHSTTLTDLPAEIRCMIYQNLFRYFGDRSMIAYRSISGYRNRYRFEANGKPCKSLIAILKVCRQSHADTVLLFWAAFARALKRTYSLGPHRHNSLHITRVAHMRSISTSLKKYAPDIARTLHFTFKSP